METGAGPGHKGATAEDTREVDNRIGVNQLQYSYLYRKIYFLANVISFTIKFTQPLKLTNVNDLSKVILYPVVICT